MRALAIDEQYGSKRGEAYLNIVDVLSPPGFSQRPTGSSGCRELEAPLMANVRTRAQVELYCK